MKKYKTTLLACFIGYIVQSAVVTFAPLLFIQFQHEYGLTLTQLSVLVTLTFAIQICGDIIVPRFIHLVGHKKGLVAANVFAATGFTLLSFLPDAMPDPFYGILISVLCYSLGASLIEVLVSPVAEACPTKNKEATMSILHSFFCWGSVLVTAGSTLFFVLFGVENWRILCLIWAIVPVIDGILYLNSHIATLDGDEDGHRTGQLSLLKNKTVWLLLVIMICAGAAEIAVSQWVSAFAEDGLKVSKTLGDLLGATLFAVLMGIGRLYYAKNAEKMPLENFMLGSLFLCTLGYVVIALSPWPVVTLIGCGMVGLGVTMVWPGTLSVGAKRVAHGGTALFALMACAGDIGATTGPTLTGMLSDAFGGNLKIGIAVAIIFPVAAIAALLALRKQK